VRAARTGGSRFGQPRAPGRDAGQHAPRIARSTLMEWIPGKSYPPPIHCFRSGRSPEGPHQPPGSASIRRVKEPARDGAAPERFRPARVGLEDPDLVRAPGPRSAAHRVAIVGVGGLLRPARRGDLLPGLSAIARAMQLGPEVPVPHRRVERPVSRQDGGDRCSEERDTGGIPGDLAKREGFRAASG